MIGNGKDGLKITIIRKENLCILRVVFGCRMRELPSPIQDETVEIARLTLKCGCFAFVGGRWRPCEVHGRRMVGGVIHGSGIDEPFVVGNGQADRVGSWGCVGV